VTALQRQAVDILAIVVCSVLLAHLGGAPRPVRVLTWACGAVALGAVALCLGAAP
jgi:hypothetical protein